MDENDVTPKTAECVLTSTGGEYNTVLLEIEGERHTALLERDAAKFERGLWRDRALKAEQRLDEVGRDAAIVRGNHVTRKVVTIPRANWDRILDDLDEIDGVRRRRPLQVTVYALAAVGAANMIYQMAQLLLGW